MGWEMKGEMRAEKNEAKGIKGVSLKWSSHKKQRT